MRGEGRVRIKPSLWEHTWQIQETRSNTSCLELHCAVELSVTVEISELFSMALIATNHL